MNRVPRILWTVATARRRGPVAPGEVAVLPLRVLPNDTAEAISARVHALEHIIYPHVCSLIGAGRVEWRAGTVYFDDQPLAAPLIEENDAAA